MAEGRRFVLALTLVGSCMAIAGVFVLSAPPVAWPAVGADRPAPRATAAGLPRLPLPRWDEVPTGRAMPARAVARPAIVTRDAAESPDAVAARLDAPLAAVGDPVAVVPAIADVLLSPELVAATHVPGLAPARPPARPSPTVVAARDHGPVSGAFIAAGTQMGKGFRTVGRTIKNLF